MSSDGERLRGFDCDVMPLIAELREKATTDFIFDGCAGANADNVLFLHFSGSTVMPASPKTVTRTTYLFLTIVGSTTLSWGCLGTIEGMITVESICQGRSLMHRVGGRNRYENLFFSMD
jgi:hypothetical protein